MATTVTVTTGPRRPAAVLALFLGLGGLLGSLAGCAPQVIRYSQPPATVLPAASAAGASASAELTIMNSQHNGQAHVVVYDSALRCTGPHALAPLGPFSNAVVAVPATGQELALSVAWNNAITREQCAPLASFVPVARGKYVVQLSLRGGYCLLTIRDVTAGGALDQAPPAPSQRQRKRGPLLAQGGGACE